MDDRVMSLLANMDVRLLDVSFSRAQNRLNAVVSACRFLKAEEYEALCAQFEAMLPGSHVHLELRFQEAQSLLEKDFTTFSELMTLLWRNDAPLLRPYLKKARWSCAGDTVTLRIAPVVLKIPGVDHYVRTYEARAAAMLGFPLQLKLVSDEALAEDTSIPQYLSEGVKDKRPAPRKPIKKPDAAANGKALYGRAPKASHVVAMKDVKEVSGNITVCGTVLSPEVRERRDKGCIVQFALTDRSNTLAVKLFLDMGQNRIAERIKECADSGERLLIHGNYNMDTWLKRMCLNAQDIAVLPPLLRKDEAEHKRVELHLHTKMSSMDALVEPAVAVQTAARWGHKAVAITDHGVVQAFPAAVSAAQKLKKKGVDIKVILGLEGYLLPDCTLLEWEQERFVAIAVSAVKQLDIPAIVEVSAVRFTAAGIEAVYTRAVEAGIELPQKTMRSLGVTEELIAGAGVLYDVLKELYAFAEGCVRVSDQEAARTLTDYCERLELPFDTHYVDAPYLSGQLNIPLEEATGAEPHARGYAETMLRVFEALSARKAQLPCMDCRPPEHVKGKRSSYHIILLAKNHQGLLNLYKLVSEAHLNHLHKVPQIPRSLLSLYREGIILGSACEAGEVFRAVLENRSEEEQLSLASFYDYLEIQPVGNNAFLVREERVADDNGLRLLNLRISDLAKRLNKPLIATGDVHFLDPEDWIYRAVLMSARDFKDAEQQAPLYFKTTDEMLKEFEYLGKEEAYAAVVENPNAIADMCEAMPAFLSEKGTYAPTFPGANDELRGMAESKAHEIYGDPLPEPVQKRLDRELNSIIGNGYASLYLMAQRLVHKSNEDGYLVGSRGSVGSSFVATMAGITEVNPLQPHYVCPNCKHSDFDVDRSIYACGVDLPDKDCPECGTKYVKLGYEIPFETFLGFKGDKTPDIDLNFSSEYQPKAHAYTEVMFGKGHAFRAGTISGLQSKTVFGYVMKYCEQNGVSLGKDEIDRLVAGCSGVKRTTGQHPGGIVIVPEENDILEFTPVQYPADKSDAGTITTHFDFHAMDDRLVKLDILGHVDPTALRMLQDMTGVDPRSIPLDDPETMRLFSTQEPLHIDLEALGCDVGSVAIPEFGTSFVRQMLMDTRPTTMEELVRIAGLSHGTDVWLGNAQDLVTSGRAVLREVICTRDDIMNYLIAQGGDPSMSFKTMESVRKGRGLTPEMEEHMSKLPIPAWFADSCRKIGYMFPRAHAAAYVMMAFRVAYFKVHYPLAFYAVYYQCRAGDAFDIAYAGGGTLQVLKHIRELKKLGNDIETKQADLLTVLEVVYEMNLRGIPLLNVDVYKSDAQRFLIEGDALRPPICAVSGVGGNAACGIAAAGKQGPYLSIEDFQKRTKANSGVVAALRAAGCLEALPETNQITLF